MSGMMKKYNAKGLTIAFLLSLMMPVVILAYTERNPLWVTLSGILLPLGSYMIFTLLSRRSGAMVWVGFIFVFFSAFQMVLSYLFGNSVVAADMFLNLLTTNPGEATELLSNIYPAVIAVVVIYLPILWRAWAHLRHRVMIPSAWRRKMLLSGVVIFIVGALTLLFGCWGRVREVLRDDVFPINVCYNLGLSISEVHKTSQYPQTSLDFSYQASREGGAEGREIYVLILGEAARASSWQLYGYDRPTNPKLRKRSDISLFRGVTTQSNTTHKSVPMMLSSVHTTQHDELYRRKGIPHLFNEAGFTTYFISNQTPQGAMVDNLACDAHHVIYMGEPRYDMHLLDAMREAINTDPSSKLLFILHTYGSHFSYHQRYPREFARFLPDDDVAISRKNLRMIRNAYDNSILYTDYFINEVITSLEGYSDVCSAVLYCSDHGEDLFDNGNGRFLHASPTITYHQVHVAALAWFSARYNEVFGDKVSAAADNIDAPATTYSVFHTIADMASIASPYLDAKASLVSPDFDYAAPRLYLNDHNEAVPLDKNIGIDAGQQELFNRAGVRL